MKISQLWQDRAAGLPLAPWWLIGDAGLRLKVYEGGDDLTLEEFIKLPAPVRQILERQYERAA
jgi:hypothetical protein